jgi:carboxypeptidase T
MLGTLRRPRALSSRSVLSALVLAGGLAASVGPAIAAAASDFPANHRAYHTYAEMSAEIKAVADAHPSIVKRISLGTSYQGRHIWAVKISDNVNVDEDEPEVEFDGVHHSDEHMGLEMTLHILHWLVDGYGTNPRITTIVNTREIWIVFEVNPDGADYDISGGHFHYWRKNRQPNANGTIGTDLNRNYSYRWGLGGRTSANPEAITYQGPRPFSAPETRVMRDFFASRVVNGVQQIRASITFHEDGRLVMWPYGYTLTNVPADMTTQDHDALMAIGKHMASTNGYRPEQASDLYISHGTTRDYLYGTYRVFSYTFEMSVVNYPPDSMIGPETSRNKEAVLWLAEHAGCPLAVLGAGVRMARCGAFDDDLEVSRGWTINPDGTDTATSGAWQRGNPAATSGGGVALQPDKVPSGQMALVTGAAAGASPNSNDLDGLTTARSRSITLPAGAGQNLTFRWLFAHAPSSAEDHLRAIVEGPGGVQTVVWEQRGTASWVAASWGSASVSMDAWAGQAIRIRFEAADGGTDSAVEAGIDDVRITRATGT